MKYVLAFLVLTLSSICAFAEPVPDALWSARLWLTSQAFGLEEDCPTGVLFRDPLFRPISLPQGGSAASRVVSREAHGDDLDLVIETTRGGEQVQRVALDLRLHRRENIVSVESIDIDGPKVGHRTLRYAEAADDDDEYDLYTDTLVTLYTTFFDPAVIRDRVIALRRAGS
jgi:hypothetical protein